MEHSRFVLRTVLERRCFRFLITAFSVCFMEMGTGIFLFAVIWIRNMRRLTA